MIMQHRRFILMRPCRMPMPDQMTFITFYKMNYLFMGNYEIGKDVIVKYSNLQITITSSCHEAIVLFDIAVLHALQTIFLETNGLRKFTTLNILKIILGNKDAHFGKKIIKEKTITSEQILNSIKKLSKFKIKRIDQKDLDVKKLLNIKINEDNLEFINEPCLVYILRNRFLQSVHFENFDLETLRLKNEGKKQFLHQNIFVIEFQLYVLDHVYNTNNSIRLENKKLKQILKNDIEEKKVKDLYKQKMLSYDLYRRKIRELENSFYNKYLKTFLVSLQRHEIIKSFQISQYLTIIMK